MIFIKIFLISLWILISGIIALPVCLIYWKKPKVLWVFRKISSFGGLPILGIRTHYEGLENIIHDKPFILLGNHQSALDILTFGKVTPKHAVVIGKKELKWIPVFGQIFYLSGSVLIDRVNKNRAIQQLNSCLDVLKKNFAIGMFPEGTRKKNPDLDLLPFKKGAFHLALQSGTPVVSIVGSSLKNVIDMKHGKCGGIVFLKVLPPVDPIPWRKKPIEEFMNFIREQMLIAYRDVTARAAVQTGKNNT